MKAISVRQPFAWLIVTGAKPFENRGRPTRYRGPLLIHAAKQWHSIPIEEIERRFHVRINRAALRRGGIVGRVELVGVVTESASRWFTGPYGLILAEPRQTNFVPLSGQRGLFDVPPEIVKLLRSY